MSFKIRFFLIIGLYLGLFSGVFAQDTTWASLSKKATNAFYGGKYQRAAFLYSKAKTRAAQTFGKTHENYVSTCNDLGDAYRELSMYAKAEPQYWEARKIIKAHGNAKHPMYGLNCASWGHLYYARGQYDDAEPWYVRAKDAEAQASGTNHPYYAEACNNLAAVYMARGQHRLAEIWFQEAKKIREKNPGKGSQAYAASCGNLGFLYLEQGRYQKGLTLYKEARKTVKKLLGTNHPIYAVYCNNLAQAYALQKRYPETKNLLLEAQSIWEKALGKSHPKYALSCNNLASMYYEMGKYEQALPLYKQAQRIYAKVLGKNSVAYAESCNNIGSTFAKQKEYAKAEAFLVEAKRIRAITLGKTHSAYAQTCNSLALTYSKQGKPKAARVLYKEAIQNKLDQVKILLPTLSEASRLQYVQSTADFFNNFYRFSLTHQKQDPNIAADLFDLQLAIKGLLFQSFQQMREQVLRSGDSTLIKKYQLWRRKRGYLAKIMQLTNAQKKKQQVDEEQLSNEANLLEKELSMAAAKTQGLRQLSQVQRRASWKQIRRRLKSGEALIELIRIPSEKGVVYVGLVLHKKSRKAPKMVVLDNGKQLEQRYIRYYKNSIQFKKKDKYSYQQFWARFQPALAQIKKLKKLYFSPDGVYHQISLATLQNPKTKRFLGKDLALQLLGSPRDLLKYSRKEQTSTKSYQDYKVYLFGYPQYNTNGGGKFVSDSVKKDRGVFAEQRFFSSKGNVALLPGTKVEIESIQDILQKQGIKTSTYIKKAANEAAVKKLKNPDILHIATHGFFLQKKKLNEIGKGFAGIHQSQLLKNPLLRSGLLFTDAENSLKSDSTMFGKENGILTAEEAIALQLNNTQLVVLSACETGLGDISNGEGVYGLQRTLQQAGARTVLMSLWKVSDNATQQMMTLFYENMFVKKQNKYKAFYNAQMTLKKTFAHPYYWGAFVMIGN